MTVSSETKRSDYAGNGSTTAFATGFRFLENSHIKVILTVDATGVETVQAETTNYTLTGAGLDAGGTVTMLVAPASGESLTIKRDVPLLQDTDYVENGAFPAESHEKALDKLTMITQQLQEDIDRSVKLPESSTSTDIQLPEPDTGKYLRWNASGNFENMNIADEGALSVSDFAKTYLDETSASATRAVLETKESFTDLDQTPSSFSGQTGKHIAVNGAEDALEFVTPVTAFTALTDTPANYTSSGGYVVKVNSGETALEFVEEKGLNTDRYAHFRDEKAANTAGGTFSAGTQTRTLNTTVVNNITGASLSSNEITLPAGTYYVEASAPAYAVSRMRLEIYNVTDAATELTGESQFTNTSNGYGSSTVKGLITLASSKNISVRHFAQTGRSTNGFGIEANNGDPEVYANIQIWKQ